jgi:hypothetical protein
LGACCLTIEKECRQYAGNIIQSESRDNSLLTPISGDMPGKPAWYKTSDMARFFVGEHVENISFVK